MERFIPECKITFHDLLVFASKALITVQLTKRIEKLQQLDSLFLYILIGE